MLNKGKIRNILILIVLNIRFKKEYVEFCYVFTGYDITSPVYYQDKRKNFKLLPAEEFKKSIKPFYEKNV